MRKSLILLTMLMLFGVGYADEFSVELGGPSTVSNTKKGVPVYPWFPDGHITILRDGNMLQMYWSGSSSYRTVGRSIDDMKLRPSSAILSKGKKGSFDNGGAWMMSVFPVKGHRYLGFYHGEDHEWGDRGNPDGIAWKSIAICDSTNKGIGWEKKGQIITSQKKKPSNPTWGGSGDCSVVYDKANSRWVCFYQEHFLYMAISEDPMARPGSWKKYYKGKFSEPGLGGKESPIEKIRSHPGANPSVHFNTYLQRWIMVWHTWTGNIVYSSSSNLTDWNKPQPLVSSGANEKNWYPTIIGETDSIASEKAFLYYAHWPDKNHWKRTFIRRPIRFVKGASAGGR